jgi:hypothetical protein
MRMIGTTPHLCEGFRHNRGLTSEGSMTLVRALIVSLSLATVISCGPPPKGGGGGGGGGGLGVDPDACGDISTSDVGRKLYQFLVASAELDKRTLELEGSVRDACVKMANELGVDASGDTKTVCNRASEALKANLQVSVSQETRLVTKYDPPVCTTDVDFTAEVTAQCEATVQADVAVTCEGTCGGTCSGVCDGQCQGSTGTGGECNGVCSGTCRGRCSADCHGYADVHASAECEASAELRASLRTECTEPKMHVEQETVTVVDDAKFQAAMRAIDAGMPTIVQVGAKAELTGKAVVLWFKTLGSLVKSSGDLAKQIGDKGVCVGLQLAGAFAAAAQVQARIEVSIEVSAEVSASAGASGN